MITVGNKRFTLTINENGKAQSLVLNKTGKECLCNSENVSLFSLTEERPYSNELKLSHPNRRTTFEANSIFRNYPPELYPSVARLMKDTGEYLAKSVENFKK